MSASDLAGPPSEKTRVPEETKPALSHWLKLQFPFLRHPYFSKRRSKQILLVESVLRAEAPDLVVAFTPEMAEETGRASRALNIPCILSLRITPESEFSESPGTIRRKLRLARLYDALDCFSGITVQIEDYVKYLPGQYRGLCKVIPNEVELDKFIDTCQKPLITRKKNIVCISGLSARKRVNFLINAFAAVSQRHPEWTLLIFGKGSEGQILKELANQKDCASKIEFRGITNDVQAVYTDAQIICLASRFEGIPRSVAEGMAAGLVAVGIDDCDGMRYLLSNGTAGCLSAAPEGAAGLAHELDVLMGSEDKRISLSEQSLKSLEKLRPEIIFSEWEKYFIEKTLTQNSQNDYLEKSKYIAISNKDVMKTNH